MNHAFLMTVHKYPKQVCEIVNILDAPNHYFFIHIDKKNYECMMRDIGIKTLSKKSNCYIISCVSVNWGGYSQIAATLELMKETIKSKIDFAFYHLISGQDFPLVDNKYFDNYFDRHKDMSFIGIDNRSYAQRYELYHLNDIVNVTSFPYNGIERCFTKLQAFVNLFIKLRGRMEIKVFKGSNWWSINKDMFNVIITFLAANPSYVKRFYQTSCCDEIFFHTIMFNSKLKDHIVTNNLRYIDWHRKHLRESLPRVLDETDFDCILNSKSLFCRKIDPIKSKILKIKIIKKINEV